MVFPRRSLAVLHRRDLIIVANDGGSKALPSMERQGTTQTVRVSLSFSAPFSTPSGYTAIISLKRAGQTDGQTAGSLTSDRHDETTLYVPFENFVTTSSIQLYIPPRFVCFSYRRDFVDLVAVVKVSLPRVRGEIDWYLELGSRRIPYLPIAKFVSIAPLAKYRRGRWNLYRFLTIFHKGELNSADTFRLPTLIHPK